MLCDNCGRRIQNEEANFCEYCGNSFREHIKLPVNQTVDLNANSTVNSVANPTINQNFNPLFPKQIVKASEGKEKPMTFREWLASYGLFIIPGIGPLLFIVMLIYWSFASNVSKTKKNWARATIIFLIACLIFMSIVINNILANPATMNYLNGNISDYEWVRSFLEVY